MGLHNLGLAEQVCVNSNILLYLGQRVTPCLGLLFYFNIKYFSTPVKECTTSYPFIFLPSPFIVVRTYYDLVPSSDGSNSPAIVNTCTVIY